MEIHHFSMAKSTTSMAIFYVVNCDITSPGRVNLHFPMVFLWFSYGFPVFLWFSYGFPVFLWFSYGFPVFRFSYGFPMVFRFSGFPMVFLWFSGFPMVFLWFSGFPMVFLWFSYGFPTFLSMDPPEAMAAMAAPTASTVTLPQVLELHLHQLEPLIQAHPTLPPRKTPWGCSYR